MKRSVKKIVGFLGGGYRSKNQSDPDLHGTQAYRRSRDNTPNKMSVLLPSGRPLCMSLGIVFLSAKRRKISGHLQEAMFRCVLPQTALNTCVSRFVGDTIGHNPQPCSEACY